MDEGDLDLGDGRRALGADGEKKESERDVLRFVVLVAAASLNEGAVAAAAARASTKG